jgi:hypothetical protein
MHGRAGFFRRLADLLAPPAGIPWRRPAPVALGQSTLQPSRISAKSVSTRASASVIAFAFSTSSRPFFPAGLGIDGYDLHLALDLVHHFLDSASALLAHFRQVAHFVRYHGKALAMLPGSRRFDGRIQRQQVGLVGDAGHGMDDLADLLRLPLQFRDHFGWLMAGLIFGYIGSGSLNFNGGSIGSFRPFLGQGKRKLQIVG